MHDAMNDTRNHEGYVDLTAYMAIKNCMKGNNKKMDACYRGDLFEYEMLDRDETKIAVVVSADYRANDEFLNVIVLTNKPLGSVNCQITTPYGIMYADCGMTSFAKHERLGKYLKTISDSELTELSECLVKTLGLSDYMQVSEDVKEKVVEKIVEVPSNDSDSSELIKAQTEAKIYKDLYENLLSKSLSK